MTDHEDPTADDWPEVDADVAAALNSLRPRGPSERAAARPAAVPVRPRWVAVVAASVTLAATLAVAVILSGGRPDGPVRNVVDTSELPPDRPQTEPGDPLRGGPVTLVDYRRAMRQSPESLERLLGERPVVRRPPIDLSQLLGG